jgi:hypothetical protein
LQDQEAIALGADVVLDGKKIGTVTEISRKDATRGRSAKFVLTVPAVEIKAGTEREEAGSMRLSSASCPENAPLLASGSPLPTRAPVSNFTRSTIQGARDCLYEFYALHPAMAIALPILAAGLLLCLLRASFRRKACLILPLCLLPVGAKSTAADLGFTRQALIGEEQQYEERLQKARAEIAAAKDRNAAGLAGLAEAPVVTGLIILDHLQVEMAGHQDRISALRRASLAYNREKEIIRLSGIVREQESRRARMADEVQALCLAQGPALTNTWPGLALYLSKRKDFALAFQAKPALVDDLIRALGTGYPPAPVLSAALGYGSYQLNPPAVTPPVTITNKVVQYITVTNLERVPADPLIARELNLLRQQASNLENGLAALRTNTPAVSPAAPHPALAQRTQLATRTSDSHPQPARPSPGTTAKKPEKVATTNGTANTSQAAAPLLATTTAATNNAIAATGKTTTTPAKVAHTGTSPLQVASSPAEARGTKSPSHHVAAKVAVPLAITVLLAALLIFGLTTSTRQHPARINLAEADTGKSQEITLIGPNDILILDDAPHSAPKELRGGSSAICRDWLGRALLVTADGTSLNGVSCLGKRRLHPGDTVTLAKSAGGQTWLFGGVSSVEPPALEPQTDPVS